MASKKGFISEGIIEEVRSRVDIVEIVSEYVSLKKGGRNFKGLCPFHSEKSPSFNVSAEKQFFHCFGCGEGGNVFRFLMKIENLSFPESVRQLASRSGVTIPESSQENQAEKSEREVLYGLNQSVKEFFESQLWDPAKGLRARKYLGKREISTELAKRFSLGLAPDSWDALLTHFQKKGFSTGQLEKAGFIKANEARSKYFDRFRNRVIFPFTDNRGRVVGFGGRLLGEDSKAPKYLNSPETLLYKKGKIFYGIHQAGKAIQKDGFATMVEGYFDLLTAFQNDIENVVANSGTALTEDHAALLKRYTENVTMVFDSDVAGRSASERGFEILLKQGLRVKMAVLPPGEDPDSYLRKHGRESFQQMMDSSKPFIEYLIDSAAREMGSSGSVEKKSACVNKILPFIAKLPSSIEKNEYINILSERLQISDKAVYGDLMKHGSSRSPGFAKIPSRPVSKGRPSLAEQCERGMVQIMIQNPGHIKYVEEAVAISDFKNQDLSAIATMLFEQNGLEGSISLDKIMELLPSENQKSLVGAIAMDLTEYEDLERAISDFARGMKKKERKIQLQKIQKEKSFAAKALDVNQFQKLNENCQELRRELS